MFSEQKKVKKFCDLFFDSSIFLNEESINLIIKTFFNLNFQNNCLCCSDVVTLNNISASQNEEAKNILVNQIKAKVYEIEFLVLTDKSNFNREKLLSYPMFLNETISSVINKLDEKLEFFSVCDKDKYLYFILLFYYSRINSISRIAELKSFSFISSFSYIETEMLKHEHLFKNLFFSFQDLYKCKANNIENKDDAIFIFLFSIIIIEIFCNEIGFSSQGDIYGMKKLLDGILKLSFLNDNIEFFSILKTFSPRTIEFFCKRIQSKYFNRLDVYELIKKNNSIKSIFQLNSIYSLQNVFLSFSKEIKRIKNFCKQNYSYEQNFLLNDSFINERENDDFIFINNYVDRLVNISDCNELIAENHIELFKRVSNIFDNVHIKNCFFYERCLILNKLLNFIDDFFK